MDVLPDSDEDRSHLPLGFSDDEAMDTDLPLPRLARAGVTDDSISSFITPLALPSLPPPFHLPNESAIDEFTPSHVTPSAAPRAKAKDSDTSLSSIQLTGVTSRSPPPAPLASAVAVAGAEQPKKKVPPRPRLVRPKPRPSASDTIDPNTTSSTSGSSIPLMVPTLPTLPRTTGIQSGDTSMSGRANVYLPNGPNPTVPLPQPVRFFDTQSSPHFSPALPAPSKAALPVRPTTSNDEDDPLLLQPPKHPIHLPNTTFKTTTSTTTKAPNSKSKAIPEMRAMPQQEPIRRKRKVAYTSSASGSGSGSESEAEPNHDLVIARPPPPRTKPATTTVAAAAATRTQPIELSSDPLPDDPPIPTAADRVKMRKRARTEVASVSAAQSQGARKRARTGQVDDSEFEREIDREMWRDEKEKGRKKRKGTEESEDGWEPEKSKKGAKKRRLSVPDDTPSDADSDSDAFEPKPSHRRHTAPAPPKKGSAQPPAAAPAKERPRVKTTVMEVVIPMQSLQGRKPRVRRKTDGGAMVPAGEVVGSTTKSVAKRKRSESFKSVEVILSSPESVASARRDPSPSPSPSPALARVTKTAKPKPAPKRKGTRAESFKSAEFIATDEDDDAASHEGQLARQMKSDDKAATVKEPKKQTQAGKQRQKEKAATPPPSSLPRAKETPSAKRKRARARSRGLLSSEMDEDMLKLLEEDEGDGAQDEEGKGKGKPAVNGKQKSADKQATSARGAVGPQTKRTVSKPEPAVEASLKPAPRTATKENIPLATSAPVSTSTNTPKPRPKMEGSLAHTIPNRSLTLSVPRHALRFGLSRGKIAPLHPNRKTPPPAAPPVPRKKDKKKVESDVEDEDEKLDKRAGWEEDGEWEGEGRKAVVYEEE